MKNFLLLCALACWVRVASAQNVPPAPHPSKQVVSVGVFGLAPNAGLQYEFRLARHFSLGVQGARYFSRDYPGYQFALVGRYHFRSLAPAGPYAQISVGRYRHQAQTLSDYPGSALPPTVYPRTLSGTGPGLGLGYRWPLGPHWALDTMLGLKFYLHDIGVKGGPNYIGDWYAAGQPGSALDGQLSLGYAF